MVSKASATPKPAVKPAAKPAAAAKPVAKPAAKPAAKATAKAAAKPPATAKAAAKTPAKAAAKAPAKAKATAKPATKKAATAKAKAPAKKPATAKATAKAKATATAQPAAPPPVEVTVNNQVPEPDLSNLVTKDDLNTALNQQDQRQSDDRASLIDLLINLFRPPSGFLTPQPIFSPQPNYPPENDSFFGSDNFFGQPIGQSRNSGFGGNSDGIFGNTSQILDSLFGLGNSRNAGNAGDAGGSLTSLLGGGLGDSSGYGSGTQGFGYSTGFGSVPYDSGGFGSLSSLLPQQTLGVSNDLPPALSNLGFGNIDDLGNLNAVPGNG